MTRWLHCEWLFEVCTDFLVDNEADGAGWNNSGEVWYEALVETFDTFVSEKRGTTALEMISREQKKRVGIPMSRVQSISVSEKNVHS